MSDKKTISYINRIDNPGAVKRATMDNQKLFEAITRIREHKKKKDFPVWSPCIFNGRATNKNAIELSCLVWDCDSGTRTFEQMRDELLNYPVNFFMHTSYSHKDTLHKYRVVFPLKNPVPVEEWRFAWIASLLYFKFIRKTDLDLQCRDARRLYYLGGYSFGGYKAFAQLNQEDWDVTPLLYEVSDREEEERQKRKAKIEREYREQCQRRDKKKFIHRDFAHEKKMDLSCSLSDRKHFAGLLKSFGAVVVHATRKDTKTIVSRVVEWPCPKCQKTDCTFFYLDPSILKGAYCNHRSSCNWSGSLWQLAAHYNIGIAK